MATLGRRPGAAPLTSADIPDDSITSAKILADTILVSDLADEVGIEGSHYKIPSVTTANRPGESGGTNASVTATNGMLVYNSTLGLLQQRSEGSWKGIASPPTITSFQYSDGAAATAEKTVVGLVSISCTTQTSTTVLVPGASLGIQIGMVVAGTGIPVGATVVSVILDTSFVISAAATASATITLTFGGAVTITGTNFDSILAGGSANIGVTFDGTSATSISVNAAKTIITCTPPAHVAGTITLQITNSSGISADTDFIYDEEAIFTTAAGTLGNFVEGTTYTANASAPRIQATDGEGSPSALTTGFQRVTSASDDTVITTTLQGLTLLTSGYLTGTLAAADNASTHIFYATAKDSQNQRTAPRLFNIISYDSWPTGGTLDETVSGYRIHIWTTVGTNQNGGGFTPSFPITIEYLVVAGGGGGASGYYGGGGGGGGFLTATLGVTARLYSVTVGGGGATGATHYNASSGGPSLITGSDITTISAAGGGYGSGYNSTNAGGDGGSGGGGAGSGGYNSNNVGGAGNTPNTTISQGRDGGDAHSSSVSRGAGGGGAEDEGGNTSGTGNSSTGGNGGDGRVSAITGGNVPYAGGGGGGAYGTQTPAPGGVGGGGAGAGASGSVGSPGGTNEGGGGGGGKVDAGGVGGSGIVIIRYAV